MPEDPEVSVFILRIWKKILEESAKKGTTPLAYLQIFSRCFAVGTRNKSYSTLSVNRDRYSESLEPIDSSFVPNRYDIARASSGPKGWAYLVDRRLQSGPICVARRGKSLAVGAGYHLATFHLGLEAHVTIMSRKHYDMLIAEDCPGSNKDKNKAAKMRSFVLPKEFIEPGSSSTSRRTVNVFAALVSDSFAIVFSDFSRIIRIHVTSRDKPWTQEDLEVTSPEWPLIWQAFPDGPDWTLERGAALAALYSWRQDILQGGSGYSSPLVDVMAENTSQVFSGFGRHLANDFLYYAAIFPGTPCSWICSNDDRFDHFKNSILTYMKIWRSDTFLKRCGMTANLPYPFAFNTTSDRNYRAGYIWVFREEVVNVPSDLYNRYLQEGLLDPDHTIGKPYHYTGELCTTKWKNQVPVHYHSVLDAYTIIKARIPKNWKDGPEGPGNIILENSYATYVGPAQFFECKQNKVDPNHALEICLRPGKPATIPSSGRGRKRKTPTRKSLEKMLPSKKRKITMPQSERISDHDKENLGLDAPPQSTTRRITRSRAKCI